MAGVNVAEHPVAFDCEGERLVGVITRARSAHETGVVILVGGPQYRVGSHRQFVLLARRLAAASIPVLRFDYRGMGDSTGVRPPFDEVDADIAAAIDALQTSCPEVRHVVLWGLCDAASSALLYRVSTRDERVAGVVLLNPWIRSEQTLARTYVRHYYGRRLLERAFWQKLARGRVDILASLRSLGSGLAALTTPAHRSQAGATFQDRMAESIERCGGPALIVLSERDLTAREFSDYVREHPRWAAVVQRTTVEQVTIAQADHTFASLAWRSAVEDRMLDWMRRHRLAPPA